MAGYTRQSSYADGDIIEAADSNNEYNQLLAAFVNTSGHKHDGTAAEGPVIGLIGDPGVATPLNKVVVDDTNNSAQDVDNNLLNVDVYIQPTRTIEFIQLQMIITRRDVSLSEVTV